MIDIYNEKLAKYADGERRIFTATFLRPDDRKGIFQNLTVNNEDNVVVKQIVLRMTKAFKELNLEKGDVVQFEAIVKQNSRGEYTVERPTGMERISSGQDEEDSGVHVVGDDWDWFEKRYEKDNRDI